MSLENKTAVVTGASRGIGLAVAKKLASQGANIAILYVGKEEEGENAKKEVEALGVKVGLYYCDVSNFNESKETVEKIIEEFGGIDILVNNAGIVRDKLVLKMEEADFDAVINVNLKGTFNMIKHTYTHFMKKRAGRIVNVASVVGINGNAGQANYSASKAGMTGITMNLAQNLGCDGITVNCVAPGPIESEMMNSQPPEVLKALMAPGAIKRMGTPEEVAWACVYLASDEAGYTTGEVLDVNGGLQY